MRRNSLAFRLTASAGVASLILFLVAGLLLADLFRAAVERNFDARLEAVLDGLLASVDIQDETTPAMSAALADTRFSFPLSGWYWQVTPVGGAGPDGLVSQSLLDQRLKPDPSALAERNAAGVARFYLTDSKGTRLRGIEQRYKLYGSKQEYSFLVAGNFDELRGEIEDFNNALVLVLGFLALGLIAAALVQVRFGLKPMHELESELNAIREGRKDKLTGAYPEEIDAVAQELNLLITANAEVIERARTQVGNLAHALKTPLSVLANEANAAKGSLARKVQEQIHVMRDQVSLYLDRARRAARARSLGAATDVAPVLESLLRTLAKINEPKRIQAELICQPGLQFRGERQDLEEIAGNLLDNAWKWASSRIRVEVRLSRDASS
ncbi:MAG: HAMP domain-containing histidine kinase, partial [Aestuariivirgaceae bacterium]|nr:HAMP domain-containing histidine kinase [Aestuariivirgaceae bacterium]